MSPPRVIALSCPVPPWAGDPQRDAEAFAPVVEAVREHAPLAQVPHAGLILVDARGPARVFGGEGPAVTWLRDAVDTVPGPPGRTTGGSADTARSPDPDAGDERGHERTVACRAGVADGVSAAVLASLQGAAGVVVPSGRTPAFLAPLPVDVLAVLGPADDLVELFERLGIRTLGRLARLPRSRVIDRFGSDGRWAHEIARGEDLRPVVPEPREEPVTVAAGIDPPAERVDVVAFAARSPAQQLVSRLSRGALVCRVVAVELETGNGERLVRHWGVVDGFTTPALVDRVRWQVDGWLSGSSSEESPTAGITLLRLTALEVVRGGRQLDTDGDPTDGDRRVAQVLSRLQGMLGPDAVQSAREAGGRDPASWVVAAPWRPAAPSRTEDTAVTRPWPGHIPPPAPATLSRRAAEVVDEEGRLVGVTGRGEVTAVPARMRTIPGPWHDVTAWAGPWPADERWWEPAGRRRARFQVVTGEGQGLLLAVERGRWFLEARYD